MNLPLQLSDAVTFTAIAALWRPRTGLLSELVWFWALSAALQAVLTPDLGETFPDILFVTYFATHSSASPARACSCSAWACARDRERRGERLG